MNSKAANTFNGQPETYWIAQWIADKSGHQYQVPVHVQYIDINILGGWGMLCQTSKRFI